MQSVFMTTFADKTSNGLLIKEIYLDGDTIILDPNFMSNFVSTIEMAKKDIAKKKNTISLNDGSQ